MADDPTEMITKEDVRRLITLEFAYRRPIHESQGSHQNERDRLLGLIGETPLYFIIVQMWNYFRQLQIDLPLRPMFDEESDDEEPEVGGVFG
jgi:hypothetical protein